MSDDGHTAIEDCAADGTARCVTCFRKHEGPDRPLLGCTGPPTPLKQVTEDLGHCIRLKEVQSATGTTRPLYYCISCGAYAVKNARFLKQSVKVG